MIEQVALDLIDLPEEVLDLLEECISGDSDSCLAIGERYKNVNQNNNDNSDDSSSGGD